MTSLVHQHITESTAPHPGNRHRGYESQQRHIGRRWLYGQALLNNEHVDNPECDTSHAYHQADYNLAGRAGWDAEADKDPRQQHGGEA